MDFAKTTVRVLVHGDYGDCYDFYTQKLGLVPTWGDRNGPYTSLAVPGQSQPCMALFLAADMQQFPGFVAATGRAPADSLTAVVPCANLDDAYERLKAAGVEFMGQPTEMPGWGMRCVYFRDTEGNLFELNDASGI